MSRTESLAFLSFLLLLGMTTSAFLIQPCVGTNDYTRTYSLMKPDGSKYALTLTVPKSLYDNYREKNHFIPDEKFVTPRIFAQAADEIRKIFPSDEDFANAILMITHQIPQPEENVLPQYPVETIVENTGDCDVFSFLAASIMKAGGLDVVLLGYSNHMNLGVCLRYKPGNSRTGRITWYPYNGENFYVAETTGGVVEAGVSTPWRVGEDNSAYSEATIISLTNFDASFPGQVIASLTALTSPSIMPPIGYWLLGMAVTVVVCMLVFKYIPRSTRRARNEKSSENGKESTPRTENLSYDAWCICPKCGAYISANIEYCPCGAKLPDRHEASWFMQKIEEKPNKSEEAKPEEREKLPEPYVCTCPKCGAWIGIDTKHCPFCSTILPEKAARGFDGI